MSARRSENMAMAMPTSEKNYRVMNSPGARRFVTWHNIFVTRRIVPDVS